MFAPGIVVYEKTRRYEAMLKRYFAPRDIVVRPCRLPADVHKAMSAMRGSVLVVDLSAGAATALRLVAQTQLSGATGGALVIAPDTLADLEWPAREFGARAFLNEAVSEEELGIVCARQWATPAQSRSLT